MKKTYITKNGEITSKEELIAEIESLLNQIPSQNHTFLSLEVMNALSLQDLESVRDSLLEKQSDVISPHRQWLFDLAREG